MSLAIHSDSRASFSQMKTWRSLKDTRDISWTEILNNVSVTIGKRIGNCKLWQTTQYSSHCMRIIEIFVTYYLPKFHQNGIKTEGRQEKFTYDNDLLDFHLDFCFIFDILDVISSVNFPIAWIRAGSSTTDNMKKWKKLLSKLCRTKWWILNIDLSFSGINLTWNNEQQWGSIGYQQSNHHRHGVGNIWVRPARARRSLQNLHRQ